MTTYILAGGCDGDYPEYMTQLARVVRMKVAKPKILSCGFSSEDEQAKARYSARKQMIENGFGGSESVDVTMANKAHFIEQVRTADVVYFHGGATALLVDAMRAYPNIREVFVGKIIIGSSAGANYLSRYGFSPSVNKACSGEGLLDVAVVVHYDSSGFSGKSFTPEYWQRAVEAVRDMSGQQEIVLLPEGTFTVIEKE